MSKPIHMRWEIPYQSRFSPLKRFLLSRTRAMNDPIYKRSRISIYEDSIEISADSISIEPCYISPTFQQDMEP